MLLDIQIGCSTNLTPLGCHSDLPITHGRNLTPLEHGSDTPIMYSLKFTSVVCHCNVPIRYSPDLTLIILWFSMLVPTWLVMLSLGYLINVSVIKTKVGYPVLTNLINGNWLDILTKDVSHY